MNQYIDKFVIAHPNFCVPAVLEMVLKHFGYTSYDQFEIASELNIVTADDNIDHSLWGAKIDNNTLNDLFNKFGIPLHENYMSINQFMDGYFMADTIDRLLSQGVSIICGYNYTWLFGDSDDTFGHVSIIVGVSKDRETLELLDPGPQNAGYKVIDSDRLFSAIKVRNDGLWCISKITAY